MDTLSQPTVSKQDSEMSETIGKLADALAKAQGEMCAAKKSQSNPFFKSRYADLAEVWDAIREPLSKNGLAVVQTTNGDGSNAVVITRLLHSSGEWIKGTLILKPTKQDPQGIGSAITYGRRYGLAAICGVVQEDDDGNNASGKRDESHAAQQVQYTREPAPQSLPSEEVSSVIGEFCDVYDDMARIAGKDCYKKYLQNKDGRSPTIEQIMSWKSPRQIDWLRSVTDSMRKDLDSQDLKKPMKELPDFDAVVGPEVSNG